VRSTTAMRSSKFYFFGNATLFGPQSARFEREKRRKLVRRGRKGRREAIRSHTPN